ncbi:MAG TPA: proline iminopeptidase-family hydrolase [Gaiellaceae bacterium]|nr:proline iminopeptidase-family hydrolase [Gaiellaceae bacterium]
METEGRIPFRGYETWYRATGPDDGDAVPLLCLHGGPGANWLHVKPYEVLADERRVVFYDQLGSGNSVVAEPHDPSLWTPELYVEEVGVVREALGLERVHVLGHSWGGMLGMQYAATQPAGLVSLIVESSPPSVPAWLQEIARLRSELPPDVEATLRRHEEAGTTDDPEYQEAELAFYKRHLCRVDPWPGWLVDCFDVMNENSEVYNHMNGPSEFHVIGTIKDWDITPQLARIEVPTLLFCGRYDEVTPATVEPAHHAIAGSELVVLEESSHMAQAEQPEQTFALVRDFLARAEG